MLVADLYRSVVLSQNRAGAPRDWYERDPHPADDALGREGCEVRFNPAGDSDLIPATIPI